MTIAKFSNKCPACGNWFTAGVTEIVKNTNGRGWVHAICPNGSRETKTVSFDLSSLATDEEAPIYNVFTPTSEQEIIFDFISNGSGHAVVEAVAGSGKTTTLVQALKLTPEDANVGFVAFNKSIANELKKKAPSHVYVSTLHALGFKIIRDNMGKVKVDEDKVSKILDDIYPVSKKEVERLGIGSDERKANFSKRGSLRRMVSLAKSTLIDCLDGNAILDMIERYNIDVEDEYINELVNKLPDVMERCKAWDDTIDLDDMIWFPLIHNMKFEQFDFLMVDEAQDMNKSQIEFIMSSISSTGRIIAVGDRYQSLYGFRAADVDAIPNIIKRLDAKVLPLSVTFRCPISHVQLAQSLVPHIQPRDNAPEGEIISIDYYNLAKELEPDDMVVCRTNAPLIRPAFECIRMKKKAIIRGRDIGAALIGLIRKFETDDLDQFEISLSEYFTREYNRMLDKGKEIQAMMLQDNVETIRLVLSESSSVAEMIGKIQMLFDDNNIGIIFSSVHRAKGLEAERVFILRPDLMPHPKAKKDWETQQELNSKYVAQTRSKNKLYFVKGGE